MPLNHLESSATPPAHRVFTFSGLEFDELSHTLRGPHGPIELESKPLELLAQLLQHPSEVLTREELLDAVWPGLTVVEGSLSTAISKLRKALPSEDIILTVPRVGYRIAVPVQVRHESLPGLPTLDLTPGQSVPGRDQWQLSRLLDQSESSEVWLAVHPKTSEQRVFKFASDALRLRALKREVTLARVLRDSLGPREDFVRLLEWNFDQAPYFLESEYAGLNLAAWAEDRGGLATLPISDRLTLFLSIARAVAAAHSAGVLHKDLKPANILIPSQTPPAPKLADFGSGALLEASRLSALGITRLGFTQTHQANDPAITGTLLYLAPEVLSGQAPTALADVYALGVILYQFLIADFRQPLAAGWEASIDDPLLCQDIRDAAAGDPNRRLSSVALLIERLESLPARRTAACAMAEANARAATAQQQLALSRARRPWLIAALVTLTIGLAATLWLYRNAAAERDRADQQARINSAINRFLSNDLIGRANLYRQGNTPETLLDSIRQSIPAIDRQFPNAPAIAAPLHLSIAHALDNRTDYDAARRQYLRAATLFDQAAGPASPDSITTRLQLATMEARTYQQDSLARAQDILKSQEPLAANASRPDLPIWLASARGMVALIDNKIPEATQHFLTATTLAASHPDFDPATRLTLQQRLAFCYIRSGDGPRAETLFQSLIRDFTAQQGTESPSTLRVRVNLAQAYMIGNKNEQSIAEVDAVEPALRKLFGDDHEITMQALTTRAQSAGQAGLWEKAIADDLAIHAIAVRKQGPLSFFAIATLADASLAQCRGNHIPEGLKNATQAYASSQKAFGPKAGLTGGAAYSLGSCQLLARQLPQATATLSTIDPKAVSQLAGDANWESNLHLAQAELALLNHDLPTAKSKLALAAPHFSKPTSEAYQRATLARLQSALN